MQNEKSEVVPGPPRDPELGHRLRRTGAEKDRMRRKLAEVAKRCNGYLLEAQVTDMPDLHFSAAAAAAAAENAFVEQLPLYLQSG